MRVLVLEKETERASIVRMVGLHIRSLELMDHAWTPGAHVPDNTRAQMELLSTDRGRRPCAGCSPS